MQVIELIVVGGIIILALAFTVNRSIKAFHRRSVRHTGAQGCASCKGGDCCSK